MASHQNNTRKAADWLQPLAIALFAAAVSGAGGVLWSHQQRLIELDRDLAKLRVQVYRQQVKTLEIFEGIFRARIQLMELRRDDDGRLSRADKAELGYWTQAKESIIIVKENYVEEHKHQGAKD